ncbi:heterokaryon incompatibility protein-domain-containing protein [Apiospora marii]|uniref:Heterokaryon incompatibility protein-domain-containing protein n=1 Tax=Apiospora marii TaxID=335849 RepID=A0ABR1SUE0_9PEZI
MPLYKTIHKWQTRLTVIKPNADRNARLELNLVTATLVDFDDEVVVDDERLVKYDALSHRHLAWGHVLGCSWFQRTWVRQEVYAARKLEVCLAGFSAPWEAFIKGFRGSGWYSGAAVRNVNSLNETYNGLRNHRSDYRPRRLLELLYKGAAFQASVPHDHIYSVLGMIMAPDNDSELVPIDYNKSYEEVCGDVMRALIRENRDVRILELCALQDNKAHALDWPHIQWPSYYSYKFEAALSQSGSGPVYWFETENPIRDAVVSAPLDSIGSDLVSCPPMTPRPLILYGTVWGALRRTNNDVRFLVEVTPEDHPEKKGAGNDGSWDSPRLVKHGLLRSKDGKKQAKGYLEWDYRGDAKEGDLFVSLEPGCRNFILRKCATAEAMFEVVGSCLERAGLGSQDLSWYNFRSVKDEGAYFLGHVKYFDNGGYKAIGENGPPGPRERFLIR